MLKIVKAETFPLHTLDKGMMAVVVLWIETIFVSKTKLICHFTYVISTKVFEILLYGFYHYNTQR